MELRKIARADLILITVSCYEAHVRVWHVVFVLHDGALGERQLCKYVASDQEQS